jgi:hypothetical protein
VLHRFVRSVDPRFFSTRHGLDSEDFRDVEWRLEALKTSVEDFRNASWTAWSGAGNQVREAADALCQKEEALLWKLRVAKHSSGFAQSVLLDDIIGSLADLEESVGSMLKPS